MIAAQFPAPSTILRLKNTPSREDGNAIEWPNVVVTATANRYEKHVPESSFSIFTNVTGSANLEINKRKLRVCEQTMFVVNPYQSFYYNIQSERNINTFNIHFNYRFFQEALYSLRNTDLKLLDGPESIDDSYFFSSQLHYKEEYFKQMLVQYEPDEEDWFLFRILQYMHINEEKSMGKLSFINASKPHVRRELLRRMTEAKDYIYSNYHLQEFSIESLCKEIAMSKFHFLRIFKNIYGCSPYHFLKQVRMGRARYLLQTTDLPVHEIAAHTGFDEPNSFYPVFKKFFHKSPSEFRYQK